MEDSLSRLVFTYQFKYLSNWVTLNVLVMVSVKDDIDERCHFAKHFAILFLEMSIPMSLRNSNFLALISDVSLLRLW